MLRCLVFLVPFAFTALAPALALAANDDCPDGWFCEPNAAPRPGAPSPPPAPAGPGVAPAFDPAGDAQPDEPPPTPDLDDDQLLLPVPPEGLPRKRRHRFREWGLNLHIEGALLADQPQRDTALAGLGFAFRYRMIPRLALEAGVDLLRGPEHRNYSYYRTDAAFLLNLLVFFNPRDVVQAYGFGGLSLSRSGRTFVDSNSSAYAHSDEHYSYFGGQVGLGVELRVTQMLAIGGDVVGFFRGRTDGESRNSDFVDSSNSVRNDASSGGLLRGGVTLYW